VWLLLANVQLLFLAIPPSSHLPSLLVPLIMADTSVLEIARSNHEESERYESALVDLLLSSNPSSHLDQLNKSHKSSILLDRIAQRNSILLDFYNDYTTERKQELSKLNGQDDVEMLDATDSTTSATFQEFYSRLNKLKDYHAKYPSLEPVSSSASNQLSIPTNEDVGLEKKFSGEESNGRYLDLYQHHETFLNLKGVKKISYLNYVDTLEKFNGEGSILGKDTKKGEAYKM